jgi:hypothetical protein
MINLNCQTAVVALALFNVQLGSYYWLLLLFVSLYSAYTTWWHIPYYNRTSNWMELSGQSLFSFACIAGFVGNLFEETNTN